MTGGRGFLCAKTRLLLRTAAGDAALGRVARPAGAAIGRGPEGGAQDQAGAVARVRVARRHHVEALRQWAETVPREEVVFGIQHRELLGNRLGRQRGRKDERMHSTRRGGLCQYKNKTTRHVELFIVLYVGVCIKRKSILISILENDLP